MAGDKKVATAQPAAGSADAGAAGAQGQPPQEKTFWQKYGGSVTQMILFWLVMRVVQGGNNISVQFVICFIIYSSS